MLKLYKVIYYYINKENESRTFESIVIAGNEVEARCIVEEEAWLLNEITFKSIVEIDMSLPQLLVSIDTKNF